MDNIIIKDYVKLAKENKRIRIIEGISKLYWGKNYSLRKTAKEMDISLSTLLNYINKYHLKTRTNKEAQLIKKIRNRRIRNWYSPKKMRFSMRQSERMKEHWNNYKEKLGQNELTNKY